MVVSTNVLVAGRGHNVLPDGSLELGESTVARVNTAVGYYHEHAASFEESGGALVMSGGYPTMATGNRIAPPPHELREGSLMAAIALQRDVPERFVKTVTSPTTTLEVVLRAMEDGHFLGANSENPLSIVTQESQWPRLEWFARRVFKLPPEAVQLIPAPGEDDPQVISDEAQLMRMTKILYGPAHTPAGLRRAERAADAASRLLISLHIKKPPAQAYLKLD